jgi:histidine triad (HIT) family protein
MDGLLNELRKFARVQTVTAKRKNGKMRETSPPAKGLNCCTISKKKTGSNAPAVTGMNDNSCIFCKIVRKQASASLVYEDENVLAFLDIRPLNEGHTLVIPKEHYVTIFEVPEELVAHLHRIVKRVAHAVKEVTKADGISIIQQNGKAADQEVFHLHVHVIPRFEGQKLMRFGEISGADREKLNQVAANIKRHMQTH